MGRNRKPALVGALLGLCVLSAWADDRLTPAYSAILQGDYQAGRAELARLRAEGVGGEELRRVDEWLASFGQVVESREELKKKTFEWNAEQSRAALARGKTFLALAFAARAGGYAPDAESFRAEPWVKELRDKALAQAREYASQSRWQRVLDHYLRLESLFPKDESIRELRKSAARYARLELIYKDREAVQQRIRDVGEEVLRNVVRFIHDYYYEPPDFRDMAQGALDELIALCHTKKLYDVFDGVATPDLREYFVSNLQREREKISEKKEVTYRDLLALAERVEKLSSGSIALPRALLIVEFVEGALSRLDDYTNVIWPADVANFEKGMNGRFRGVGIQLGRDETTGRLKVVTPLENSPALEAGIQPGDLIFEVDGVSTKGWTTDNAVEKITGEQDTRVTLTIFRPSTRERLRFPLVRREIHLTTVRGVNRLPNDPQQWNYMLDREAGVAYVRLTGFNQDSQRELVEALTAAREQGMRGLILDLRHNPGGMLDTAVATVSLFLGGGEIVSTRGRSERPQRIEASGGAPFGDVPLVVLVNEASASASEILAGTLQDHGRAVVLGERTFGKGSVQRVLQVTREARLKLTTALYYLPSNRSPHRKPDSETWGVDPDWKLELTPKEFGKIVERENRAFVIHSESSGTSQPSSRPDDQPDAPTEETERGAKGLDGEAEDDARVAEGEDLLTDDDYKLLGSDPYKAPDADPQLETALLHLRVKLAANIPWPRPLARAHAR
jgi:carboxyl-terminal processing protease